MPQEEILVQCTNCNTTLRVFASDVERIVKCHVCQKFTKIPGKLQKRMELNCPNPQCRTVWNIPVRQRGKIYKCWNCHQETQLPAPAEFHIEEIALVEQIEQGGQNYETIISVSNPGTPAQITGVKLSFTNKNIDVSNCYDVQVMLDESSKVDYVTPLQVNCVINTTPDTPVGSTTIVVEVSGQDLLDDSSLAANATVSWVVIPQRMFAIATENDSQEKAGEPFALQLWGCFAAGDLDPSYEGVHEVHFNTTAEETSTGVRPIMPQSLQVEFHNGVGITGREFIFYNAAEMPQVVVWEDAIGGPKGTSKPIRLQHGMLQGFQVNLSAPQINQCPFDGDNHVCAVDQYGNIVSAFQEDVWIYPGSNRGEIAGNGLPPNLIPANCFQGGIADLTALKFVYTAHPDDTLPKQESFIVSFHEKEGCSQDIIIDENPVQAVLEKLEVSEHIEQGSHCGFRLVLKNQTHEILLVAYRYEAMFTTPEAQSLDEFYQLYWENQDVECAPQANTPLSFRMEAGDLVPVGTTVLKFTIYVKDKQNRVYGKFTCSLQWQVEPKGRIFQVRSPESLQVEAGKKFALQIVALFADKSDSDYKGKHMLRFEVQASPSPSGKQPEIPKQLEVDFSNGVGKTAEAFSFTNAGENPRLRVWDESPGGPRSTDIEFTVTTAEMGSFVVSLPEAIVNKEKFPEQSQVIALDIFGNLKSDFAKTCLLYPASQKGGIYDKGQPTKTLPEQAFAEGIADLGESEISYRSDIQERLPKQEEFIVEYDGKKGKSKPVKILPSIAKIVIVRCSSPEEIEPGGKEYPIYLELENSGDQAATISSVLFSFDQKGDVSAYYSLLPSTANSNQLIPGVPLQLAYTVKTGAKTPPGQTKIDVKVTGIDMETKSPLQARTSFEWSVESGKKFYRITSEHKNVEEAGIPFALKVEAFIENARDTRLNGEANLLFHSTAAVSPNGKPATIPEQLTVNFKAGEGWAPAKFILVNASQMPVIHVTDGSGKIESQSEPMRITPGSFGNVQIKTASKIREKEEGINSITVQDGWGNIKEDFAQDLALEVQGVQAYLLDDKQRKLNAVPKEWMQKGICDLSLHKVQLVCVPEQKLPARGFVVVGLGDKRFRSNEFEVMARPVAVTLEHIQVLPRVVQGQKQLITFTIINKGTVELEVAKSDFVFSHEDHSYRYPAQQEKGSLRLQPGSNSITYGVSLPLDAVIGKINGKVSLKLTQPPQSWEISVEGNCSWFTEPAGRQFLVQSENRHKETAGIPFALKLIATWQGKPDASYEGQRSICFASQAMASPSGQAARIPKTCKVEFQNGEAVTSRDFILFNIAEQSTIEAHEDMIGGALGTSEAITLRPSGLQEFRWQLARQHVNAQPFQNKNLLMALDSFGNIKSDFQEDVRIHTLSQKGDVCLAGLNMQNMVPGHAFQGGVADLTTLKLAYRISRPDYLPLPDRLIASYGEKKGESDEITILPRQLAMSVEKVTFPAKVFQGETARPLTFAVKNTSDIALRITQAMLIFDHQDKDVSAGFSVAADAHNSASLGAETENMVTYYLDVAAQVDIGPVVLTVALQGASTLQEERVEARGSVTFEVMERLRDLALTTQHENTEIVGEPFAVKIAVFKNGEPDVHYEGAHEICFKSTAKGELFAPSIPAAEVIQFNKGVGQSSATLVFTSSNERPAIIAEEKGKAIGSSAEIALKPGSMQSIKITFDNKKIGTYTLQALDRFNNVLEVSYKLDDDIKTNVLLTGSQGTFYEVLEIIGYGGMGKVYKAKRLNDDLMVAVKTTSFSSLGEIGRFLQEGELLIRFDHPNIVKGYDMGQVCLRKSSRVEIELFMVMEYLPGQSVKRLIDSAKQGVLSPVWATEIIVHVARGLIYMWDHKTLHRDIKPDNIQITEDHKIKLIDLGIAKAEGVDINLTNPGTVVGSYPYISPERLKDTGTDFRSDIYSLGASYYHMVTGMPPYLDTYQGSGGKDLLEYLMNIRTKKMPTPPQKLHEMPVPVSNMIMTMLQIKTNKRFNTPEDMLKSLEQLQRELSKA
jgi:hypothetical protein